MYLRVSMQREKMEKRTSSTVKQLCYESTEKEVKEEEEEEKRENFLTYDETKILLNFCT